MNASPSAGQEPPKSPPPKLSAAKQAKWDKAQAVVAKPDKIELYSLNPDLDIEGDKPKEKEKQKEKKRFHGYEELGMTVIKVADARKMVLTVAEKIKPGQGLNCFWPRHGIRVTAGAKSVDYFVCFECE